MNNQAIKSLAAVACALIIGFIAATAQGQERCGTNRGFDPHEDDPSVAACVLSSPSHNSSFYVNTDPDFARCGICTAEDNDAFGNRAHCLPEYARYTAETPGNAGTLITIRFCGTRAQCNAVGGVLEDGRQCAEAAEDCDLNEEFMPETGGAPGGICVPCTDGKESMNGGECRCPMDMSFDNSEIEAGGVCEAELEPADCEPNEILIEATNRCIACGTGRMRISGENVCDCPAQTHFQNTETMECEIRIEQANCPDNTVLNENTNRCDCPEDSHQEFDNGTPGDESDDFCAVSVCRDDQAQKIDGSCECPAGEQSFNNGTENDVGDDFCAAPLPCRNDQILNDDGTNQCVCAEEGMEDFSGGCAEPVECNGGTVRPPFNSCLCPQGTRLVGGVNCFAICTGGMIRDGETDACVCPEGERELDAGTPDDPSDDFCTGATSCRADQELQDDNTCACPEGEQEFDNGTPGVGDDFCDRPRSCPSGQERQGDNTCACPQGLGDFTGGCAAPVACNGGIVEPPNNVCVCPAGHDLVSGINCFAACTDGKTRVRQTNVCQCPAGQEEFAGRCAEPASCRDDQELLADNTCACPEGGQEFDNGTPADPSDDFCSRANAAASSASSQTSSNDDRDDELTAAALIAVPAVLGMYVAILNGFAGPEYDFNWDAGADNEEIYWTAQGKTRFQMDGLSSYVSAMHSSREEIYVSSGMRYDSGLFMLSYDASESADAYGYSLRADSSAQFGAWTMAPVAETDLEYRRGDGWDSESSLGLESAWTANRWIVKTKYRRAFGPDAGRVLDIEVEKRF